MRDGIFRSSSLPSRWRKVGNFAANEADSKEHLSEALKRALRQEFLLGYNDPVIKKIFNHVSNNNLSLLSGESIANLLDRSPPARTQLGGIISKDIAYACSKGHGFNESTLMDSCGQALREYSSSILQELSGYAFLKCSLKDYTVISKSLNNVFECTDYREITCDCFRPNKSVYRERQKKEFNMNENLL